MNADSTIEELTAYVQTALDYMAEADDIGKRYSEGMSIRQAKLLLWAARRLAEVAAILVEKTEDYLPR